MRKSILMMLHGLSFRLLMMTIMFVMGMGVAFYIPSVAQFRIDYLQERLATAQTAALALEEMPEQTVSDTLGQEILTSSGLNAIIVIRRDSRQLLLRANMPGALVERFDLRQVDRLTSIAQAYRTIRRRGDGYIQVHGGSMSPRFTSVVFVMEERPLYQAMIDFSVSILGFVLAVSLLTAALVYLSLHILVVRPMARLCDNVAAFRADPEDAGNLLIPTARRDEIGMVEAELARMQSEIRSALAQKTRLADLGLAISKISHDLRNVLAISQLWTDRLRASDSASAPFAARLINSIDRAVSLCERTLKYGKADEPPPLKTWLGLSGIVNEVGTSLQAEEGGVVWKNEVPADSQIFADSEQLFRLLLNLGRNALQVLKPGGLVSISTEAGSTAGAVDILFADNGPGLPETVKGKLFVPFLGGGGGSGGAGLGLAIVRELSRAHGGDISLEKSDGEGTTFRIRFPGESSG